MRRCATRTFFLIRMHVLLSNFLPECYVRCYAVRAATFIHTKGISHVHQHMHASGFVPEGCVGSIAALTSSVFKTHATCSLLSYFQATPSATLEKHPAVTFSKHTVSF